MEIQMIVITNKAMMGKNIDTGILYTGIYSIDFTESPALSL